MRFCENCGYQTKGEGSFCPTCGARQALTQQYCPNCGSTIRGSQLACPSCGSGTNQSSYTGNSSVARRKKVNMTVTTIVGYLLPGLPSILWFNQKIKGILLVIITFLALICIPVLGNIMIGVFGAVDAYKLALRVNLGERLGEWTFFWN